MSQDLSARAGKEHVFPELESSTCVGLGRSMRRRVSAHVPDETHSSNEYLLFKQTCKVWARK
eukprot:1182667-Amphidinium_carterae.1